MEYTGRGAHFLGCPLVRLVSDQTRDQCVYTVASGTERPRTRTAFGCTDVSPKPGKRSRRYVGSRGSAPKSPVWGASDRHTDVRSVPGESWSQRSRHFPRTTVVPATSSVTPSYRLLESRRDHTPCERRVPSGQQYQRWRRAVTVGGRACAQGEVSIGYPSVVLHGPVLHEGCFVFLCTKSLPTDNCIV